MVVLDTLRLTEHTGSTVTSTSISVSPDWCRGFGEGEDAIVTLAG